MHNGYFRSLTNWSASWVSFEVAHDAEVEIEITRLSGDIIHPILRARVRPGGYHSMAQVVQGKAIIQLTGPQQITVDMDGGLDEINTGFMQTPVGRQSVMHTFSIFANLMLSNVERPDRYDADVRTVSPGDPVPVEFDESILYFLPGVHNLTFIPSCCSTRSVNEACRCSRLRGDPGYVQPFELKSGKRYYITTDAFLNGWIESTRWLHDVQIFGFGTLSGMNLHWKRNDWDTPKGIFMRAVSHLRISGITLVDFGNHHIRKEVLQPKAL